MASSWDMVCVLLDLGMARPLTEWREHEKELPPGLQSHEEALTREASHHQGFFRLLDGAIHTRRLTPVLPRSVG